MRLRVQKRGESETAYSRKNGRIMRDTLEAHTYHTMRTRETARARARGRLFSGAEVSIFSSPSPSPPPPCILTERRRGHRGTEALSSRFRFLYRECVGCG